MKRRGGYSVRRGTRSTQCPHIPCTGAAQIAQPTVDARPIAAGSSRPAWSRGTCGVKCIGQHCAAGSSPKTGRWRERDRILPEGRTYSLNVGVLVGRTAAGVGPRHPACPMVGPFLDGPAQPQGVRMPRATEPTCPRPRGGHRVRSDSRPPAPTAITQAIRPGSQAEGAGSPYTLSAANGLIIIPAEPSGPDFLWLRTTVPTRKGVTSSFQFPAWTYHGSAE